MTGTDRIIGWSTAAVVAGMATVAAVAPASTLYALVHGAAGTWTADPSAGVRSGSRSDHVGCYTLTRSEDRASGRAASDLTVDWPRGMASAAAAPAATTAAPMRSAGSMLATKTCPVL